jgi:hypothetical protein
MCYSSAFRDPVRAEGEVFVWAFSGLALSAALMTAADTGKVEAGRVAVYQALGVFQFHLVFGALEQFERLLMGLLGFASLTSSPAGRFVYEHPGAFWRYLEDTAIGGVMFEVMVRVVLLAADSDNAWHHDAEQRFVGRQNSYLTGSSRQDDRVCLGAELYAVE